MRNNTNTSTRTRTRGEAPYEVIALTPRDLEPKDWAFLNEWANNLGVPRHILLTRILIAAIFGQLYAEKIPEH